MKVVECLKATKAKMDEMKPTKRWNAGTLTAIPLDLEKLAKAANEGQELNMWVELGKEMIARRYAHRLQGTGRDARRYDHIPQGTSRDARRYDQRLQGTSRAEGLGAWR